MKQMLNDYGFEPLLRLEEAAQVLGLHPDTIKKKARLGEIPAIKLGKYWRFRLSQLDAWLKQQVLSSHTQTEPR